MKLKQLILMVGIPGSGKSTLCERLAKKGFAVLNADSIRQELWGDSTDQRDQDQVFKIFFERMDSLLAENRDIVVDNINTNPKHREQLINRAKAAGYIDIQLWVLDVPLDICLKRNAARDRKVPEEIVSKMHGTLNGPGRPKKHEGRIIIVRPADKPFEFRFFTSK